MFGEGTDCTPHGIQPGGLSAREYKHLKGLRKENLRDNMADEEFVMNMLAGLLMEQLEFLFLCK